MRKLLQNNKNKESGAIAIETALSLTFFIIAVLAVMFMSLIIRMQANMQYALDQAAKEISGYYYLPDKLGITSLTTGPDSDKAEKLNNGIDTIVNFSSAVGDASCNIMRPNDDGTVNLKYDNADFSELAKSAQNMTNAWKDIMEEPQQQGAALVSVLAKTAGSAAMSKFVAPFICQNVMPKYLGGDTDKTTSMLENWGVVSMDGSKKGIMVVDFSGSELLADGRSIKLVVRYRINLEKLTLGMVHDEWTFQQVASTAAWVAPNDSIKKVSATAGN